VGYVNGIYVVFVRGAEENKRTSISLTKIIHLFKVLKCENLSNKRCPMGSDDLLISKIKPTEIRL